MTATNELRALLDERGVEWRQSTNTIGCVWTYWESTLLGGEVCAMDNGDGTLVMFDEYCLTPEQAIEATLGRGECHDLAVTPDYRDKTEFKCSICGYEYSAVGGFGCDQGDEPDFCFCPNCGRRVVA